ncbi:MAG: site-2 protease family protein [Sulfurospirillum sp.]|nr:MAG: site-2 protease family protein [Sulfurospirillum sp.]
MEETKIAEIGAIILALAIAIIGHEIMHGRVAYHFGDDTAKLQGRLSINPLVHIDPVGTIIVPALLYFSNAGFLFGWAKPVPINISTVIRNGGYNAAIAVALAGITFNFALALSAALVLHMLPPIHNIWDYFLHAFLTYTVVYNIVLGIFNLMPIPPLDGSHVVTYQARKMGYHDFANKFQAIGQYGMILLMLIIATPVSDVIFAPMMRVIDMLLP